MSLTADPVRQLEGRRPDLFEAPPFWRNTIEDITAAAESARVTEAKVIGHSAGGRELWSFTYGPFEPQNPTATISSAMGSDHPEAYFDPALRTRPVLVLIGSIHGGETEGIVTALDLIHLLETGRDLQDREQPERRAQVDNFRLIIIPCLNPDGRLRAGIRHLNTADLEHLYLVQQGILADGTPFGGRRVKEIQPIPPGYLSFMGGYYNDDGVNLQHDDFFGPRLAPENQALRDLFQREMPDAFLAFHAHAARPSFYHANGYLSPGVHRRQCETEFYILSRLTAAGFEVIDPAGATGPAYSFCFQSYFHHVCGALPLACELPHGMLTYQLPLDRILDAGRTVLGGWFDFAARFGQRPPAMTFFSAPPPA